jgi:hypothetical protein
MSMLTIVILVAAFLLCVTILFLTDGGQRFPMDNTLTDRNYSCEDSAELGALIVSRQDWEFIRSQGSAPLEFLFVCERRIMANMWVRGTGARLRAIRQSHIRNSRHSANLDVLAEARLFMMFFYLGLLCRLLLVALYFFNPIRCRPLALHFGSTGRALSARVLWISNRQASESV